ncbi:dTDP-4-dehydrorhamnose 3,5-epimerase [uncultured Acetobacterium sp.]|uniref:dTDP-4-dehydrorhamnose 3,5-epimerase n=1 Tax=uncultured Acetobacterium sp. TaxID=217139 RepID=UPI0025D930FE|nr:dTDP-4-dehydrorhamnose 3,5-epimerase [uncultured Acetobacterium sp.]
MYQVNKTALDGCLRLEPNIFRDHRGTSIKTFHIEDFRDYGINNNFVEDLIVVSNKNVLRGLHFQNPPFAQAKLVYCVKGSILDVVLDIRRDSPTYGNYEMFNIDASNFSILYIKEGFAHGYLALEVDTVVMYKMSSVYNKKLEGGIRWNSIDIPWGISKPIISERDESFVAFNDFRSNFNYVDI